MATPETLRTPVPPPPAREPAPAPRGGGWKVAAILLALLAAPLTALSAVLTLPATPAGDRGAISGPLLGGALGILLVPLLFVLVARLCARPFTPRSFWKSYCLGMALCSFAALGAFGRAALVDARGDAEATPLARTDTSWQTYRSADGRYRIELPGTPEPAELSHGEGVKLIDRSAGFSVTAAPLADPEVQAPEVFALIAERYRSSQGVEVQASPFVRAGLAGQQLRMILPDGQDLVARLYVRDGVLYQTAVNGKRLDPARVARFLDSFALATPEG